MTILTHAVAPPADIAGLDILIVEDEALVAMTLELLLTSLGCRITGPAMTRERAADLAGTARFDLAVLDVCIGGDTIEPVVAMLQRRGIPLVLCSGHNLSGLPPALRTCPLLGKPYSTHQLQSAIAAAAAEARWLVKNSPPSDIN